MPFHGSVDAIKLRLARNDVLKTLALGEKFFGSPGGTINRRRTVLGNGVTTTTFTNGGVGGGGGGGGAGAGTSARDIACGFLTGRARDACLLTFDLVGRRGGGGGAGGTTIVERDDPGSCPPGQFKIAGRCFDVGAAMPGGDPFVTTAGGVAVAGGFGLPAFAPGSEERLIRKCNRGMVLGIDNLCYPKAVLPPRSKFRKWRRAPAPPLTRRDVTAIRRSKAVRDRVKDLAQDVGFTVHAKGAHRKKKKKD